MDYFYSVKKSLYLRTMKSFSWTHFFEPLENRTFFTKRMFGGLAVYYENKMVAVMFESPGDNSYKGKKYAYDLWNGIMFPTFKEHQASLFEEFNLVSHPVLGKWAYIPSSADNFESEVERIVTKIKRQDERFGIFPKTKRK